MRRRGNFRNTIPGDRPHKPSPCEPDKPLTPDGLTLPLPKGLLSSVPRALNGEFANLSNFFTIGFDQDYWGGPPLRDRGLASLCPCLGGMG